MAEETTVLIRYRSRHDDAAILEMDQGEGVDMFVTGEDLASFAAMPGAAVWVAERAQVVVGFACVLSQKKQMRIVKLIVSPPWRRRSVGRQLVNHLVERLGINKIDTLMAVVPESELGSQLFFGKCGMLAEVVDEHILFVRSKRTRFEAKLPLSLEKRITWNMP